MVHSISGFEHMPSQKVPSMLPGTGATIFSLTTAE